MHRGLKPAMLRRHYEQLHQQVRPLVTCTTCQHINNFQTVPGCQLACSYAHDEHAYVRAALSLWCKALKLSSAPITNDPEVLCRLYMFGRLFDKA